MLPGSESNILPVSSKLGVLKPFEYWNFIVLDLISYLKPRLPLIEDAFTLISEKGKL